jgi:predicted nucleic acid-binding protein
MGNVCIKKQRRNGLRADLVQSSLQGLVNLQISLHEVDPVEVLAVAAESGLTFYDASYLWLATKLAAPLVTLDKRLQLVH